MIYGYARVSTDAQNLSAQLAQLKAAGCETVFREKESGATADRPQLKKMLAVLRKGDVVIAPAIDRLSRDTTDLLVIARDIQRAGAGLRSLAEPLLDTTSDFAEVVLAVLGIAAKFERRRIKERTALGRAHAKARGVKFGRKPKLTEHQRQEAIKRWEKGDETLREIAASYNVSHQTISRLAGTSAPQTSRAALDSETEHAAQTFMRHLSGRYPVREAILYGSRARHTHAPDSDADIAVVLDGAHGDRETTTLDMAGIAFNVLMETGVRVQPLPLWSDELARPDTFSNPALIRNILREGVRL